MTFDCDTATIRHELYGIVRDGIPDHFNIKEEVILNFHKDKRTVIIVEALLYVIQKYQYFMNK
ncbi:MAG: hypothetical protein CM15mP41_1290 [Flammeovirgaceae bacterium]|nr:MAG: hypothetical protein CM15mP41_1290 [Flammeovirgaceae bacterium]